MNYYCLLTNKIEVDYSPKMRKFDLFFLNSSSSYLALPSFPTRRSSDLSTNVTISAELIRCAVSSIAALVRASQVSRSEEHTSELQSRRDLVCRLLLEKKTAGGK